MQSSYTSNQAKTLARHVATSPTLSAILDSWTEIGLPDCWLAGSSIAQTVWNAAFGLPPDHGKADIDLVYFDDADLSAATEAAHEARLRLRFAGIGLKLDLKNQARVHLWYPDRFGFAIPPYRSAAQAIGTFPTTSAAVGIRPGAGGLEIVAPFGLTDLLTPIVRPNRVLITRDVYEAKLRRWKSVWPLLKTVDWDNAGG
jgi:hypothetical protein